MKRPSSEIVASRSLVISNRRATPRVGVARRAARRRLPCARCSRGAPSVRDHRRPRRRAGLAAPRAPRWTHWQRESCSTRRQGARPRLRASAGAGASGARGGGRLLARPRAPGAGARSRRSSPRRKRHSDRHMQDRHQHGAADAVLADRFEREDLAVGQVGAEAEAAERAARRSRSASVSSRARAASRGSRCSRSARSARPARPRVSSTREVCTFAQVPPLRPHSGLMPA